MDRFLPGGGAASRSEDLNKILTPRAVAYITTVLNQSTRTVIPQRSQRGLRTLGEALDHLVAGELSEAADVLMQRFKAVEATSTGAMPWAVAENLEIIPTQSVTSVSAEEAEVAAARALRQHKMERMIRDRGGKGAGK